MNKPFETTQPRLVDETSWRYRGWLVAVASMIALMFGPSTVAILSFGAFIHPIEVDFGWTRTQVAIAITIVSYVAMFISPLQGYLIDKFGSRKVILPCIPLFSVSIGMMYFIPPIHAVYYVAWLVIPTLAIGLFPASYLRAVSSWFDRKLGMALGIANAGIGLGAAFLPLILSFMINLHGWRFAYMAIAVTIFVITFPAALFFIHENPNQREEKFSRESLGNLTFKEITKTVQFRILSGAFLLLGVVNTALVVHQIPLLIDAGVSPERAAVAQSTFGVFVIIGRLVTGLLIDYVSAPLLMTVIVLGGTSACTLYAFGVSGDIVFLCAALIGMLVGAEFDVLSYLLKKNFGMASFGKLYGLIYAVFSFGAGAGAALLPMTREMTGGYRSGLLVFALSTLFCAILLITLSRKNDVSAVASPDSVA